MGTFSTTSIFGGTYAGETISESIGIHHSKVYCVGLAWTNSTGAAKTAVCGKSEVHTLTFANEAGTTHGDYISMTDTNGLKWAAAASKGGVAEQTTITCIGEGTVDAVAEQTSIVAVAETGVKSQTTILCTADTAINPLDQETFILYDKSGSVGVWIDTGSGTAPLEALACARQIKVTITANDLIGTVGTAVYNALDGDAQFVGISDDTAGTIVVSDAVGGVRAAGTSGTTPFTLTNNVVGVASNLDEKFFVLNDEGGSVGVWIDVDNRGTSAPTTGCTRNLEVTTINTGDSASDIGGKLRTAIDADSKFNQSGSGATCVAVNIATQALAQHANAGTSGFAVTTTVDGVTAVASALQSKYFVLGDATGSATVGFWFNIASGGSVPAGATACTRQVEITTVAAKETAAQVAAKVRTAIDGDSKFDVGTLVDATFNAICKDLISVANGTAGDSGFTVTTAVQGTALGAEPTGAIWAAIPAARKCQFDAYSVAGTKTAITIAGLAVAGLNALVGFTDVVTLADIGDGTVTVTHVVRGPVTVAVPKSVDDSGAGSITVADSTNGVVSTVNITDNTITVASHGWTTGLKVVLTVAPGSIPTGLVASEDEFIIVVDANTVQIADTLADALAGTAKDITDQGTDGSTITITPTAIAGGVVHVEGSIDNVTWYDIANKTTNVTATGSVLHEVADAAYNYVRVHFTCTAGQVLLTGKVSQKG